MTGCSSGLQVELLVLDDERTSTHAVITERKQSPTGACTRYRYGFAFTAVRGFRHQVIFGSLVPPRPLSQRRFDDLGRIVVSVVGCT